MPYAGNGQISQEPIAGGVEISDAQYMEALEGMLAGLVVSIDNGFRVCPAPELEPVKSAHQVITHEQVDMARRLAYSDPITGSDRFIAELFAERASGNEFAAQEAANKLLARRKEIKAENPWPEQGE